MAATKERKNTGNVQKFKLKKLPGQDDLFNLAQTIFPVLSVLFGWEVVDISKLVWFIFVRFSITLESSVFSSSMSRAWSFRRFFEDIFRWKEKIFGVEKIYQKEYSFCKHWGKWRLCFTLGSTGNRWVFTVE